MRFFFNLGVDQEPESWFRIFPGSESTKNNLQILRPGVYCSLMIWVHNIPRTFFPQQASPPPLSPHFAWYHKTMSHSHVCESKTSSTFVSNLFIFNCLQSLRNVLFGVLAAKCSCTTTNLTTRGRKEVCVTKKIFRKPIHKNLWLYLTFFANAPMKKRKITLLPSLTSLGTPKKSKFCSLRTVCPYFVTQGNM